MILKDIYSKIPKSLDDKVTSIGFDGTENDFKIQLEYDDMGAYTSVILTINLYFDLNSKLEDYSVEVKRYIKDTCEDGGNYLSKEDFSIINKIITIWDNK